jgi:hypothetical protein
MDDGEEYEVSLVVICEDEPEHTEEHPVTNGIKWPPRPGYGFLAVFQIAFSRSNRVPVPMPFQQSKVESASEANQIRSWILYFRPFYARFLHSRPSYAVLAQPQLSLNASVYPARICRFWWPIYAESHTSDL